MLIHFWGVFVGKQWDAVTVIYGEQGTWVHGWYVVEGKWELGLSVPYVLWPWESTFAIRRERHKPIPIYIGMHPELVIPGPIEWLAELTNSENRRYKRLKMVDLLGLNNSSWQCFPLQTVRMSKKKAHQWVVAFEMKKLFYWWDQIYKRTQISPILDIPSFRLHHAAQAYLGGPRRDDNVVVYCDQQVTVFSVMMAGEIVVHDIILERHASPQKLGGLLEKAEAELSAPLPDRLVVVHDPTHDENELVQLLGWEEKWDAYKCDDIADQTAFLARGLLTEEMCAD